MAVAEGSSRRCIADWHVDDQQLFGKLRCTRDDSTAFICNERAAVKDQLVLTADLVDIHHRHARFCGAGQHSRFTHAALVSVEWRAVDVDRHLCAGSALSRERTLGDPDVFTDAE